jgi:PAS domain S-box-containing protein
MLSYLKQCRIRTKLLLILLAAGIPLALCVCFLLYNHYEEEYHEAEHAALTTAKTIGYQHQSQVEGIHNLLINLSQFPEVKRLDTTACARLLGEISQRNLHKFTISIADPQGNLLVTGSKILTNGGNVSGRKYYKDLQITRQFSTGEFAISKTLGTPTIHYALPVLNSDGSLAAVLIAIYDLTQFNTLFTEQKLPAGSTVNVTDHKGIVMHRYPPHHTVKPGFSDKPHLRARMIGTQSEGVFNDFGADDVKRLLAFKRLQLSPNEPPYLYIRVSITEKEALEDTYLFVAISAAVFLFTAIAALLFSRFLARRYLAEPLESIARASQTAKGGDFSARTGLPYTDDEIGQLAHSFDSMAASLESRQQDADLAAAVQKSLEQALRVQISEFQESQEELQVTTEMLEAQVEEFHQTHDQLLATEEMLRVQLDAVEASEHKFRAAFDLSPITIALTTYPEGVYLEVNQSFIETFGYAREEIIGRSTTELNIWANPDDRSHFLQEMQNKKHINRLETEMRVKNGGLMHVLFSGGILEVDGRQCLLSVTMDVSEQKELEGMLVQSQKMEAIGTLSGGIAHDFNNLLTPIIGYADMLLRELAGFGGKVDRAERIIQAAMKARDLTRQLLTFGRKQTLDKQVLDLNDVVERFADMLRRTIRENIQITLSLSPSATIIRADRTQIEQIIMNLVVNAQDAIAGKGSIIIETASVMLDEEFVRSHPASKPGRYILMAVSDSGCGMDKAILNHIFEPFFTTKNIGEGTGLGLANVYGIVKQHEGTVWVYSEPGHGTVFKVYLPCVDESLPGESAEPEADYAATPSGGKVLVVEDNEDVRVMVCDLLRDLGYTVLETEEPLQAISLIADNVIDLLITDVIMPGMNGPELYDNLLERQPGLKVLFMSGYTDNIVSNHIELKDGLNFIQKPFTLQGMSRKVADLLSEAATPASENSPSCDRSPSPPPA